MEGLTEGRIVHVVLPNGEHRPAMIVRVWPEGTGCKGYINVQVFTDGANDVRAYPNTPEWARKREEVERGMTWEASICYDETGETPRTWHWIERA